MRHFSTTASALRLSALIVAAGSVLGLAGQVVAQSAPMQAERAHREATEAREQARRIVVEMRKELADSQDDDGDEQEVRVFVQPGQGGVWTTEAPRGGQSGGTWTTQPPRGMGQGGVWTTQAPRKRVQVEVQPEGQKRRTQVFRHAEGDEGQQRFEVQVQPGEGKRKVERIQVKRLGGEGAGAAKCPACGCECCGGDGEDRVIELHGLGGAPGHIEGHFGEFKELGELKELHGMKIQGLEGLEGLKKMHIEGLEGMKLEGLEGKKMFLGDGRVLRGFGMGGQQPKVFGKAIVIGPDGKQQEFNFGGDDAAPRAQAPKAPKPPKAPKAPKAPKPAEGKFFEAPGPGMHGGHGEGKVIIITPDGQRREFNFGGENDGPRSEVVDPFDGNHHTAHPFGGGTIVVPQGTEGVQGQVKFVRVNRGGAV